MHLKYYFLFFLGHLVKTPVDEPSLPAGASSSPEQKNGPLRGPIENPDAKSIQIYSQSFALGGQIHTPIDLPPPITTPEELVRQGQRMDPNLPLDANQPANPRIPVTVEESLQAREEPRLMERQLSDEGIYTVMYSYILLLPIPYVLAHLWGAYAIPVALSVVRLMSCVVCVDHYYQK